MINFYNEQTEKYEKECRNNLKVKIDEIVDTDEKKISWSRGLKEELQRKNKHLFSECPIVTGYYRPFFKQNLYLSKVFNELISLMPKIFPNQKLKNLTICIPSAGDTKDFSVIITDCYPDYGLLGGAQCFPLYYYEENKDPQATLFDAANEEQYIRRDAISDFILKRCKTQYGKNVTKEDIFYYVYGFLHSPTYRKTFASDLKKMLPRLPLVDDVRDLWAFSKAGRELAELHLNYENVKKCPGVVEYNTLSVSGSLKQANAKEVKYFDYRVEKMRFPKKDQKDTIIYNSQITLKRIPLKAYDYIVNGKSAIEWVMERYQVTTHKESGIVNDPNLYAEEHAQHRYILDLLHSVINLSVETMKIVGSLPKWDIKESVKM